jgi:amino acid transporter
VRDPRRHLPRALLGAIALVALLYILIQVVCIGTLADLGASKTPLADAAEGFLPHKQWLIPWGGRWTSLTISGGVLISAGAIISIIGNLNIVLLSGARVPFAMAEQRQLPEFLTAVHRRFFTPYIAVAITALVMLVLTLKSSFVAALTISAIARLVTYGATCASLVVLRHRSGVPPAGFKLRGGSIIAVASLLLAAWLLANSTWTEAWQAGLAAGVGLVIYAAYRIYRARAA